MLIFLGPALVLWGALVYLGRKRLYMRNLNRPEPSDQTRARAVRWNTFLGSACVAAGVVVAAIGVVRRL